MHKTTTKSKWHDLSTHQSFVLEYLDLIVIKKNKKQKTAETDADSVCLDSPSPGSWTHRQDFLLHWEPSGHRPAIKGLPSVTETDLQLTLIHSISHIYSQSLPYTATYCHIMPYNAIYCSYTNHSIDLVKSSLPHFFSLSFSFTSWWENINQFNAQNTHAIS